jgi:hypothetical protein
MTQALTTNPFPLGTVVSDSGLRLADFRGSPWTESTKLIAVYRENYFAPQLNPGLVMGIRGRFGSGKTHLAFQLRDNFAQEPLVGHTVYAKIDHSSFLELYKSDFAPKIMEQINVVIAIHLAKLLRLRTRGAETTSSLPSIAQKAVDEAVASSPQRVLELVEQDLLPVGGLTHALDTDLEDTSSDLTRDFLSAYIKLREPAWSKVALRWFEGETLTPAEREDLGLHTSQIAQPDQARRAMRFLLEVHRKADVPVLLCIDEFERFVVRGSAEDQRAFPSFLKDLAEMFASTGNALLLCGAEDAWRQLPGDAFDRIRRERIIEVKLTENEAESLLSLYCENSGRKLRDVFDSGTTAFLIDVSERNARRMLNISYEAFALAQGGRKISRHDVREAAAKALADDQRYQSMDEAILRVARSQSLGVSKQLSVSGATLAYALDASSDRPIFLALMRSSFKTDEVTAGRTVAAAITEAKKGRPGARAAVIVLGYSTAEVREQLQQVFDAVLVYDEDRFADELADFLRTAPAQTTSAESKDAVYNQSLQRFAEIENKRNEEFNRLAKQLEAMEAALRSRSTQEQEERVTDKIAVSITELQGLLKQEQDHTEQALRYTPSDAALADRERIVRVLDGERALVRRLELLNDGLPEAGTFRAVLTRFMSDMDSWEQNLEKPLGDLTSVRAKYRRREEVLSELELRHMRRMRHQFRILGFRVSSRSMTLVLLSLAAVVIDLFLLISGGFANGKIVEAYYSSVLAARSALSQLYTAPSSKDLATQDLVKTRAELDSAFSVARASRLPISILSQPNSDLINAFDKLTRLPNLSAKLDTHPSRSESDYTKELDYIKDVAETGIRIADELLSLKPSVPEITLIMSWRWMAIAWLPALAVLIWSLQQLWFHNR